MIHHSLLGALGLLAPLALAQETPLDHAKDVAAPPSDIRLGQHDAPEPRDTAARAPGWIAPLAWRDAPGGARVGEVEIAVDADGPLSLAILARGDVAWRWTLVDPAGVEHAAEALVDRGAARRERAADLADLPGASADRLDLAHARAGTWIVRAATEAPASEAWVLARTAGGARLVAHASTLATHDEAPIALVARLEGAGLLSASARADVEIARDGLDVAAFALELRDDGASGDGAAGDGTYAAFLPRGLAGLVRARIEVRGTTHDGAPLARATVIAFPLIERALALSGATRADVLPDGRVAIRLGARPRGPATKVLVAAELWGTRADGAPAPVCWLARMQAPRAAGDALALALHLDPRWLALADAGAPHFLRRVRVQDPDTSVPHDLAEVLPLALPALAVPPAPPAPTIEMLQGPAVQALRLGPQAPATPQAWNPALLLVHGYCSGGAVWPAAHFSEPKLAFLDADQNRTHDEFALLLRQAGSARSSFGVVAHSQGGQAALHLYTYYASGLDRAQGPRRIQSVGSPYLGTPLASLGGFACGVNADMTTSGGPAWLAGIPTWARAEVHYWTTSNSGSACNFWASLVLDDPEDGTTEMVRGQLAGGVSMGHIVGWCHTTGMSNPAQYTDAARNAERDAQAAR